MGVIKGEYAAKRARELHAANPHLAPCIEDYIMYCCDTGETLRTSEDEYRVIFTRSGIDSHAEGISQHRKKRKNGRKNALLMIMLITMPTARKKLVQNITTIIQPPTAISCSEAARRRNIAL